MNFPFPFLTIFLIGIIMLAIKLRQAQKSHDEKVDRFWEKERDADMTPPKDLDRIEYVKMPLSDFAMGEYFDSEIEMIEEALSGCANNRMININGMTNTDIKLEYGAANLEQIAEYGDNFSRMTLLLCDYAKALMEKEDYERAQRVLEFGYEVGSDISSNYMLLGDCYAASGDRTKLDALIADLPNIRLTLQKRVEDYLRSL